jgi:hypothetical protein
MCGASKVAKRHTTAKVGETYNVLANQFNHGAFVPQGETAQSCTACLRGNTQMVTFMNLPAMLANILGQKVVDGGVVARFVEVDTGNHETSRDQIDCGDGIVLDFKDFAGTRAYIGVHPDWQPKSMTKMRMAATA